VGTTTVRSLNNVRPRQVFTRERLQLGPAQTCTVLAATTCARDRCVHAVPINTDLRASEPASIRSGTSTVTDVSVRLRIERYRADGTFVSHDRRVNTDGVLTEHGGKIWHKATCVLESYEGRWGGATPARSRNESPECLRQEGTVQRAEV
jgi:hypothetical protein